MAYSGSASESSCRIFNTCRYESLFSITRNYYLHINSLFICTSPGVYVIKTTFHKFKDLPEKTKKKHFGH